MTAQPAPSSGEGIRDIVTAERASLLNGGVVTDSDSMSVGLLRNPEHAAAAPGAPNRTATHARRTGFKKGGDSAATCGETGQPAPSESRMPTRSIQIRAAALHAATDVAIEEADDAPELHGIANAYSMAVKADAIARKLRAPNAKRAGAHKEAAGPTKARRGGMGRTSKPAERASERRRLQAAYANRPKTAVPKPPAATATASNDAGRHAFLAKVATAAAPAAGVVTGVLAFILATLMASQLMSALFGFWDGESQKQAALQGLPPYITYAMVEAALECQEDYGHPAGCTIAQIICESGMGNTMSRLATRDHNLFGMKWAASFAAAPEVAGKASWITAEEYGGQHVTITDAFTVFKSDADCIRFRSRVFLQQARYAGNPLIVRAIEERDSDLMAEGLKDAGWATSSTYVESLKSVMDEYGLRRFDSMDAEDLEAGISGAGGGNAVVEAARSQLGVPYVWGGSTPYVGLDCSGLTQWCYAQAGIAIPRHSEAQAAAGAKLPLSQAKPGDILWRPGHVAIYIGGDEYIHEPMPGDVCRVATGIGYFTCAVRMG